MGLRFDRVTYSYSAGSSFEVRAVREVSFAVEPGDLVLVLGTTGSGKSTLLRLAASLLTPSSGVILLDGAELTARSARGEIGLVFQDAESQLFADTVLDDVAFGPRNFGATSSDAAARAREALSRVGLDPVRFGDRSPFALSGGEARRAAIAGVLAMNPRYLLADEPTAGLDVDGRAAVRAVIDDARGEQGIVIVSHSPEEFLSVASHVLLIHEGSPMWWGAATDLIQSPEFFASAGLMAPDVLEVQRIARDAGRLSGPLTLDAERAASRLIAATGVDR